MKLFKLLLSVVGATVLLGALVSTASAGRIASSGNRITAGFSRVDFRGGFGTTECPVTLAGSLHSTTIVKSVGALIGYITDARLGRCTRGSATILTNTLPWHVRYRGFTGTLPSIRTFITDVTGSAFQIREPLFGITCLASRGTPLGTYNVEPGGTVTGAVISGRSPTNCGVEGELVGTSNSITAITVTLI